MECGVVGEREHYETPYFHPEIVTYPPGMDLPSTTRARLNHLRTGVGCSRSCLHKWSMASSAACVCGAEAETSEHDVLRCPIHRPPYELHGLTVLDDETMEWLLNTCPDI